MIPIIVCKDESLIQSLYRREGSKMSERIAQLRGSRAATFFNSFSPSSKAALVFAIPFTIVDAVHYYTAGTAIVISFPVIILIYLACGVLAGKLTLQESNDFNYVYKNGAITGFKLWFLSTFINTVLGLIIGVASLGLFLLVSIPYLILCAPFNAAGGVLISYIGSYLYALSLHFNRT